MTAVAIGPAASAKKPKFASITVEPQLNPLADEEFTPGRHLAYKAPSKVHMMRDLGFPEEAGISPVAVSEPFPLFTEEAINRMRHEVLSPVVMDNCQYSSNLAHCQLRGFANKYAPFTYDVWKSPETLAIISKIAGIDLIPEMDLEIAHINMCVKSEAEKQQELEAAQKRAKQYESDEGIAGCPYEDDTAIVGWHKDSYPFVCVTMLSDCTNMIGGETALRTGNGDIMKVRGPQRGCAVVLQGRYIEHQALQALGCAERITMVTSFRPRSPYVRDDTVLSTVRPISDLGELYHQFTEYRLEILEERVRAQLKQLREAGAAGRHIATSKLKSFFLEQERFLAHMNREMVDELQVVKGDMPVIKSKRRGEMGTTRPRKRLRPQ